MIDNQQKRNEEFFKGGFYPKKGWKILKKRSQKLIDFVVCPIFLKRIAEKVFDKY
jgi:hypothetical protein